MPVLTRISAAKRLRDTAELAARRAGKDIVTAAFVAAASPSHAAASAMGGAA